MAHPKLKRYLDKIQRVYNIKDFTSQDIDRDTIIKYYTQSSPGYAFFHSTDGSVHMAVSSNGEFSKDDYYAQARHFDEQIKRFGSTDVLELASGKGFNTVYLAQRNPNVRFTGIDITPLHVDLATQKSQSHSVSNAHFELGDFHSLKYPDQSFDYIFEVESVCHALNLSQVLNQVYRVMRPGGVFTLFDGFKKKSLDSISEDERIAALLVEKSMAVSGALTLDEFLKAAQDAGFEVIEQEDISEKIMPNLLRFQFLARGFFKYAWLGKAIKGILPDYLVQNAIAGMLMPIVVGDGIQGYYKISLKRPL